MKKINLCIIFCLIFVFSMTSFVYAGEIIVETPKVKIVIDGNISKYTDIPINANGRTMLPMVAILTDLGVKNDKEHIKWNSSDRSITILKDSTKIFLKVGDKKAYVNDEPVTIDAAPMIYKNKTYIPASFVALSLGKKVVWDGSTSTVLITDNAKFEQIKDILSKSDNAMLAVNKLRLGIDMAIAMKQAQMDMKFNVKRSGEMDKLQKLMHFNMNMDMPFVSMNSEYYFADNVQYAKNPMTGEWESTNVSDGEFEQAFTDSDITTILNSNDALCAGLAIQESPNPDEILLKGNVYLDELMDKASQNSGDGSMPNFDSTYMEVSINKNTYVLNKIYMKLAGNFSNMDGESKADVDVTITYSDYDGSFEIKVPQDVIQNAVEVNTIE